MLTTLKKKYAALTEPQSPSIYLVATGTLVVGLAGYILLDNYKTMVAAGELLVDLVEKGVKDYDHGDVIIRITRIQK